MDLGCGTGELAIPLAKYFENVHAVDPDDEMLMLGCNKANQLNIHNIEWQKGSSRALAKIKESFKLVSIGQSFHWMEPENTLNNIFDTLENNGHLIIIDSEPIKQNNITSRKDEIIKKVVKKYLGPKRRAGKYFYEPTGENWETELFPNSAFGGFEKCNYLVRMNRSTDQIIGNIFSMSWASKKAAWRYRCEL